MDGPDFAEKTRINLILNAAIIRCTVFVVLFPMVVDLYIMCLVRVITDNTSILNWYYIFVSSEVKVLDNTVEKFPVTEANTSRNEQNL